MNSNSYLNSNVDPRLGKQGPPHRHFFVSYGLDAVIILYDTAAYVPVLGGGTHVEPHTWERIHAWADLYFICLGDVVRLRRIITITRAPATDVSAHGFGKVMARRAAGLGAVARFGICPPGAPG